MITKQKGSEYYYAVIYDGGIKRKWYCLKTTDQREAWVLHDLLVEKHKLKRREAHIKKILEK